MKKLVTLTIDGLQVTVPEGTMIVDAAKKAGIDIPVFCYHPKLEPVGMCRMCLVEIGRPQVDRATGDFVRETDGSLKIEFSPKLETACTTLVAEGIIVSGLTERVKEGREDVLEFLLTSHPLDCPICDKGGECPLQNLTMGFGPGQSRFLYDEKKHLAKHIPLGELIYLDRERCIQCARCVRFQEEIVDDRVIGFTQRGRAMEIVSFSEPGFDSYFSGNTTDICPVGALTTADFRFAARPWELNTAASICPHCPVGCNTTLNTRREAAAGGKWVIKRVMPRQNEWVNEIWICDKGRFAYHYAENNQRLTAPLVRRDGELVATTWEDALEVTAKRLKDAGDGLLTLASGRLSNEDLYNLKKLTSTVGGRAVLYTTMAGGDLIAQVGVAEGTNFSDIGPETVILVVASQLEEEAPIWWLRVKQAADRGAVLMVANPRPTKIERYARYKLRYPYGSEAATVLAMVNALSSKRAGLPKQTQKLTRSKELQEAAKAFAGAENALVFYGSEGIGLEASQALAQACANLLITTNHVGRPGNGLVAVWPRANDQGAWDVGFKPLPNLKEAMKSAKVLYIVAADPAGDDPGLAETGNFMIVQDLFLTDTARLADVVLPVESFIEREGSYTNGERRVQRFFPAIPKLDGVFADYAITGRIARLLGIDIEDWLASAVFSDLAENVADYAWLSYAKLAQVEEQWPLVGCGNLYYGGTTYENRQGLGVHLSPAAQRGESVTLGWHQPSGYQHDGNELVAVPITRLYDFGRTVTASKLLNQRIGHPLIILNPDDADELHIVDGEVVQVLVNGISSRAIARLDFNVPVGILLVPRSMGVPITTPTPVQVRAAEQVVT